MSDRSSLQQRFYDQRLRYYDSNEKPKPGEWYTVPKGSWLDSISIAAYGRDRTDEIIDANAFLASRPIHEGSQLPYIHPGDRLWLPSDGQTDDPDTIPADNPEEIAIRIDGKIYRGWEASNVERAMNTCADVFTFVATYDPDSEVSRVLDPYSFKRADLFIGGDLYISGIMLKHTSDPDSASMTVEVRSLPGETIENQSLQKSTTYNGQTMKQIADAELRPFGIETDFPDGDSDAFVKANRDVTDEVFSFLAKLAKQKGLVITSTLDGKMAFVRANTKGRPVAALKEGQQPLISVSPPSFDSSVRHSHFIAVSQSAGTPGNRAEVKDDKVKLYRPHVFTADTTESGNITDAATWKRNRSLSESAEWTAIVRGWRDPNRALWMENTVVTLYYPRACVFKETKMIITKVRPTKGDDGNIVELSLALPASFTLDEPEEFPWVR
jgi:prophage tail gpP-like protein